MKGTYDSDARYINYLEDSLEGKRHESYTMAILLEKSDARIAQLEEALRFYAITASNPNDGPWGVNSKDYGYIASIALGETT
jgi:hypothetical protein